MLHVCTGLPFCLISSELFFYTTYRLLVLLNPFFLSLNFTNQTASKSSINIQYLFTFCPFTMFTADKSKDISKFKDNLVLLHPSLMQLTGICIGSHCVVNNSCVRVAWPSTSLPMTGVGLQDDLMEQLGCVKGQLITVQLQEKFGSASEVELTCSDPRYNFLHHV